MTGTARQGPRTTFTEVERQCAVRDANEATARDNDGLTAGVEAAPLRCECGDPTCRASVAMTRSDYEDVRCGGSRFLIETNHENPETACVVREVAGFAVIDVVAPAARYVALARNSRHAWGAEPDAANRRPGHAAW